VARVGAECAFVLGSGLDRVADAFAVAARCCFEDIPGLGPAQVSGHRGEIVVATVSNTPCLLVCGRRHFYEGDPAPIPILMRYLYDVGVRSLVTTSAAGALGTHLDPGDLVSIDDIIDFQDRPRRAGPTAVRPVSTPPGARLRLDASLAKRLQDGAKRARVALRRGTLLAASGPVYETHSEVSYLQRVGADVASMSAAPEVAAANDLGIGVASIALVTNWATGVSGTRLNHADVLAEAGRSAAAFTRLLSAFFDNC